MEQTCVVFLLCCWSRFTAVSTPPSHSLFSPPIPAKPLFVQSPISSVSVNLFHTLEVIDLVSLSTNLFVGLHGSHGKRKIFFNFLINWFSPSQIRFIDV